MVWAEEEGGRFGVACLGSRLLTGSTDPDTARALRDPDGVALDEAAARAGLDPALLGPDPERPSVYYSALWTRAGGQAPISAVRRPVYIVAFHDSNGDGFIGNSEYDHLVLRFGR